MAPRTRRADTLVEFPGVTGMPKFHVTEGCIACIACIDGRGAGQMVQRCLEIDTLGYQAKQIEDRFSNGVGVRREMGLDKTFLAVRVVAEADKAGQRLALERSLVISRLTRMDQDMAELFAASRGANADDEHDPEGQTVAYERSQLAAMIRQAQAHVDEIDAATARVVAGTYGVCEVCRQPIGVERLKGRPAARACVEHAVARG